jgi:hypothetical protein
VKKGPTRIVEVSKNENPILLCDASGSIRKRSAG